MLLGREAERERIDGAARRGARRAQRRARAARRGGIGKTALLEHAGRGGRRRRGAAARGVESEVELAFAGLHELLAPALDALERLPAPQAAALRGALGLAPAAAAERHLVGAATLAVLGPLAETRPVLVLADDAHWLDRPSASALLFAARRLLADAVAVLVAVRDGRAVRVRRRRADELSLPGWRRTRRARCSRRGPGADRGATPRTGCTPRRPATRSR